MEHTTTQGRALSIAAGGAFTTGGLTILLGEALFKPSEWSSYHLLTILTVFGTIAAGHLMADAIRARAAFSSLGFLVLFLTGTGLVVVQSVGRQAESSEAAVSSSETANKAIADKRAELDRARQRLADAEKMVELETKRGGCKSDCRDWKTRSSEVRSHVQVLESELKTLGAPKPVAPKAERLAAVAELAGFDGAKTKVAFTLLEPFLWTLFFELGTIICLGFAFRHRPVASIAQFPPPAVRFPAPANDQHPVIEALERAGGSVESNRQLAQLMSVTDGESSKRVAEVVDRLEIVRDGKQTRIALKAA